MRRQRDCSQVSEPHKFARGVCGGVLTNVDAFGGEHRVEGIGELRVSIAD
jgi:hypothetical protein